MQYYNTSNPTPQVVSYQAPYEQIAKMIQVNDLGVEKTLEGYGLLDEVLGKYQYLDVDKADHITATQKIKNQIDEHTNLLMKDTADWRTHYKDLKKTQGEIQDEITNGVIGLHQNRYNAFAGFQEANKATDNP